jgi:hypothetical protein
MSGQLSATQLEIPNVYAGRTTDTPIYVQCPSALDGTDSRTNVRTSGQVSATLPCAECRRSTPIDRLRRSTRGTLYCQRCLDEEATAYRL